MVSIRIRTH